MKRNNRFFNKIEMEKIDNDLYILSKSGAAVLFDNKHGLTAPKAKKTYPIRISTPCGGMITFTRSS